MSWGFSSSDVAALKVGDRVGISSGNHFDPPTVELVTRRTATQVIVGNDRFNKYGRAIGGTTWKSRYLMPASEALEMREQMLAQLEVAQARNLLSRFAWHTLTPEQCNAVKELLATFKESEPHQ